MQLIVLAITLLMTLLASGCSMLDSFGNPFRSDSTEEFDKRTYIGVSGGVSRVAPDTSSSSQFSLDDSMSSAAAIILGRDLGEKLAVELQAADLGEATLSPPEEIAYSAVGLSALYYALGTSDTLALREGFAGFGRIGVNLMRHDSDVTLDREDNAQLWLGLGADYFLQNGFVLRAELAAQDTDAQSAQLALLYRFGGAREVARPTVIRQPAPQTSRAPQPSAQPVPRPAPQSVPQSVPVPQTIPVPAPAPQVAVTTLANGPLAGVGFQPDTTEFLPGSLQVLDALANQLRSNPAVVMEVQAHADGSLGAAKALQLSRARVLKVGKYLISQGVASSQLSARAFGASRPLAQDGSAASQRLNNRIELKRLR